MDIRNIDPRDRQIIVDSLRYGRTLDADRAETEPKVFTRIHMHFIVKGRALSHDKVRRAIDLSIDKYCSASAMMARTAKLTHDFEVVDTAAK